jgi:hypothetical protein
LESNIKAIMSTGPANENIDPVLKPVFAARLGLATGKVTATF